MAKTLKIPKKVINSDWKDDIDYQTYQGERVYISPRKIKKETLAKIKGSPIKLSINKLVNWDRVREELLS